MSWPSVPPQIQGELCWTPPPAAALFTQEPTLQATYCYPNSGSESPGRENAHRHTKYTTKNVTTRCQPEETNELLKDKTTAEACSWRAKVRDTGCLRFADEVFRGLSAMVQKGGCNSARGETQDTEVRELDENLHTDECANAFWPNPNVILGHRVHLPSVLSLDKITLYWHLLFYMRAKRVITSVVRLSNFRTKLQIWIKKYSHFKKK